VSFNYEPDKGRGVEVFKRVIKPLLFLPALALGVLPWALRVVQAAKAYNSPGTATGQERKATNTWNWSHSEGETKLEVKLRNKVEFNDDYSDIKSLSEDGYFSVRESRGATSQRIDVTSGSGGQLRRAYFVGDRERDLDDKAGAWLARIIRQVVLESGIDAPARVQKIYDQGGASAVLDEISRMNNYTARRIYFGELMKTRGIDVETLQDILRRASSQIKSDFEMASLLINASEVLLSRDALHPSFFEAAGEIKSDYEHRRVLSALINKSDLGNSVLIQILNSAAGMSSDYEKATFLVDAAQSYKKDAALLSALLESAKAISSAHERGRVESALSNSKNAR
jgi:hypothetical protein